jgi:hypothetical protein
MFRSEESEQLGAIWWPSNRWCRPPRRRRGVRRRRSCSPCCWSSRRLRAVIVLVGATADLLRRLGPSTARCRTQRRPSPPSCGGGSSRAGDGETRSTRTWSDGRRWPCGTARSWWNRPRCDDGTSWQPPGQRPRTGWSWRRPESGRRPPRPLPAVGGACHDRAGVLVTAVPDDDFRRAGTRSTRCPSTWTPDG